MFNAITYEVTFSSTNRTLKGSYELDKGFWVITGSNESGKSMVLELMRFGLFGSTALRGKADDYQKVDVDLDFTIRGETYNVKRTLKKAVLYWKGEPLATSTSVVNKTIVQLLGFGIKVFDIACSVNQGEVERLGSMKPTERRQLVDTVVGLDALDNVAKWAREEARVLRSEVEGIERHLVSPSEPERPEGYKSVEELKPEIAKLEAENQQRVEAEAFLKVPGPTKRDLPTCDISLPAENLKPLADQNKELDREILKVSAELRALNLEEPKFTAEQLDEIEASFDTFEKWQDAEHWLARHPRPNDDHRQYDDAISYWEYKDALDELMSRGHVCEACDHVTPPDQDMAKTYREALAGFETEPDRPEMTRRDYKKAEDAFIYYNHEKFEELSKMEPVEAPQLSRKDIVKQRLAIDQQARREGVKKALAKVQQERAGRQDYEEMYDKRVTYERDLAHAQTENQKYLKWEQERNHKQGIVQALQGVGERLGVLREQSSTFSRYDQDLERYKKELDVYRGRLVEIEALRERAEDHGKAVKALAVLRGMVKQFLLPSLNKVSSQLLALMTGGQRRKITVDDDFDVMVDDQPLYTLSGSGKSVANLSLRIGLAQVLTNRTFSVLLADEIDAAMDEFRAEKTSDVLRMLVNTISQVLLVSHKSVEAEKRISLGATNDGHDPQDL